MASYELLQEIVNNGCDLTIYTAMSSSVLDELAAAAKRTGARLTITTSMNYDVISDLMRKYGNTVAFMDGLEKFKKD
jgi:hypothetical protein